MTTGYSDRINHAFAFAAKHHDQQVRKGTRLPYLTRAPNVAVILTRYGQPDETVIAGILYDVAEDYVREGSVADRLEQRIGGKFGADVLRTLLAVVERRDDDAGTEMSHEERRDDLLARLSDAPTESKWVLAADQLHGGSALLGDLCRTDFPETVWARFAAGREGTVRWYRRLYERLVDTGFDAPIMREFDAMAGALEERARRPVDAEDGA
ncbi:MAG TPA: HD domain-containing protein [Gemmatimonadaceae bacterium]|nr:HD domain-containing protein [Gemmatimonadaceae bacterium]